MQAGAVEDHLIRPSRSSSSMRRIAHGDLAGKKIVVRGHREDGQSRAPGHLGRAPAHSGRGGGQRDDDVPAIQLRGEAADVLDFPEHAHSQQNLTVPGGIVFHDADHAPLAGASDLAQQVDRDVAGADDDDRFAGEMDVAVQGAFLPRAIGDPTAGHIVASSRGARTNVDFGTLAPRARM
jgi:hypothetical protein